MYLASYMSMIPFLHMISSQLYYPLQLACRYTLKSIEKRACICNNIKMWGLVLSIIFSGMETYVGTALALHRVCMRSVQFPWR